MRNVSKERIGDPPLVSTTRERFFKSPFQFLFRGNLLNLPTVATDPSTEKDSPLKDMLTNGLRLPVTYSRVRSYASGCICDSQ